MSQKDAEQILYDLKDAKDLDSHVDIWRILSNKCESLMTLEPDEHTTLGVWILDKTHKDCIKDEEFISLHLPSHRVIHLNGYIRDR